MRRAFLAILLCLAAAGAANQRLYLKDGTFHVVREYKVDGDRVRYYSVERGDWEEIPLELVDLKKTKDTAQEREETARKEQAEFDAEEKFERAMRAEIERIPQNPGAYYIDGGELRAIKQAESKIQGNKRRSILKAITPIPIMSGKATVELDGATAPLAVTASKPEFYFRLAEPERFAIVKLAPTKAGNRVVAKVDIVPVVNERIETVDAVDIFRHQVGEGLYKIWPVNPLEPGEYAVVEYTETKVNFQIWDFSYRPGK
ncbi:MAG TPA: hypothetical protein DEH78_32940 [Solibacterales bacterium]|nr:hypothetical protein [Bryobacterales bacterium]